MKNVLFAALLAFGLSATAQQAGHRERAPKQELSTAQRNELQLKKMTLELDLNPSQQKEMATIIAEQNAKREAIRAERKSTKAADKALTQDQRFERRKQMLDDKIAVKARVKKILNDEQFKKWESMRGERRETMRKHGGNRRDNVGRRPQIQK